MYAGACGADVPGNPNIAPEPNMSLDDGDLSKHPDGADLGEGDVLLTANSSAGVAAAFGAPFGAVLFAIEEGASYMNNIILLKLFVAAAVATLVVKFFIAGFSGLGWGRLGARVPVSFGAFGSGTGEGSFSRLIGASAGFDLVPHPHDKNRHTI